MQSFFLRSLHDKGTSGYGAETWNGTSSVRRKELPGDLTWSRNQQHHYQQGQQMPELWWRWIWNGNQQTRRQGETAMKFDASVLNNTEKIIFALRALYMKSGYSRYTMSRFEEYDLYSRNKEFLVSDGVITFTDTNGMLMALKPDVTLSIIRNCIDEEEHLRKLCYNESVYRISKRTGSFKEIMQTGLECMGKINASCLTEVISLAGASLGMLSDSFILEVSDMDILLAFLDEMTDSDEVKRSIIKCAGERNIHEITEICILRH